jgi:hypothetical protein
MEIRPPDLLTNKKKKNKETIKRRRDKRLTPSPNCCPTYASFLRRQESSGFGLIIGTGCFFEVGTQEFY